MLTKAVGEKENFSLRAKRRGTYYKRRETSRVGGAPEVRAWGISLVGTSARQNKKTS